MNHKNLQRVAKSALNAIAWSRGRERELFEADREWLRLMAGGNYVSAKKNLRPFCRDSADGRDVCMKHRIGDVACAVQDALTELESLFT